MTESCISGTRPRPRAVLRANVIAAHVGGLAPGRTVIIGDVKYISKGAKHAALVPQGYMDMEDLRSPASLELWQWLIRKDALGQDAFLLGPPGPQRRWLALAWCELLGRETEYLALSRDTTESDLKQRREIVNGSLLWMDQAPVRAAREGRVLILDGLEKAERNVLPTLNNLLENREMALQDGTFLTSPERFDSLDINAARAAQLIRVHESFRVIALGLPVPEFPGFPLDPPLRSRFQARRVIGAPVTAEFMASLSDRFTEVPSEVIEQLATFNDAMKQLSHAGSEIRGPRPWPIPGDMISAVCKVLSRFPAEDVSSIVHRSYPHTFLLAEPRKACEDSLSAVGLGTDASALAAYSVDSVEAVADSITGAISAEVAFSPHDGALDETRVFATVSTGGLPPTLEVQEPLVDLPTHATLLSQLLQSVALGLNICLVGPCGEGKTTVARRLAAMLGYPQEKILTVHAYKDMTSRDLFQRRGTDERGDTVWEASPLLTAVGVGGFCILDGLHRLRPDTIAALQTLCTDRELDLPNGTRFCHHDRYLAKAGGVVGRPAVGHLSQPGMPPGPAAQLPLDAGRSLRPVHQDFRLIALAAPPGQKAAEQWLSAEVVPLFAWHVLPRLSEDERAAALSQSCPSEQLSTLLRVSSELGACMSTAIESSRTGWNLSLRQMLRLGRRLARYPTSLASDLRRSSLTSFMPLATRSLFDSVLSRELGGMGHSADFAEEKGLEARVDGDMLDIGGARLRIALDSDQRLIPQTKFFDIPRHLLRLREIMRDLSIGEKHFLLIGNQGTGKNKLVDRLLQLLQWEREYIQLHRDTTVSALTVQATLVDGRVVWEDSPLVRAVQKGRVLVVDEADKAPLEVVCILKGLVEDGEMTLSDGRRILRDATGALLSDKVIPVHPSFKLFLLANRPGFPFQGNDLFRETGDVYACHIIENPDVDSEVQLLQGYAPDVEVGVLKSLSSAFTELRERVDEGLLTYPYSTRELVNVARHLQTYPQQSVGDALRDILDFDQHDPETLSTPRATLARWGIPLDVTPGEEALALSLATESMLPPPVLSERWLLGSCTDEAPEVSVHALEARMCSYLLDVKTGMKAASFKPGRSARFTEELCRWQLPLAAGRYDNEIICGAVVLPDSGKLCVLTEGSVSRSVSVFVQQLCDNMSADITSDRLEAAFQLRTLDAGKQFRVEIVALGPHKFGLLGDRRIYVIDLSNDPAASEIILPPCKSTSVRGEVAVKTLDAGVAACAPLWNTVFALQGVLIRWSPGGDALTIVDIRAMQAHILRLAGVSIVAVWALRASELVIKTDDDQMSHIDIFPDPSRPRLSTVEVERLGERPLLQPRDVIGDLERLHTTDACGTVTSDNNIMASLSREPRGAFARKPTAMHFGKDAFACTVWPRPHGVTAVPMYHARTGGLSLTAVKTNDETQAWMLEIVDVDGSSVRVVEPLRMGTDGLAGAQLQGNVRLVALQMYGSHAVLLQSDGWIRVWEVSASVLENQRRVWQSMLRAEHRHDRNETLSLQIHDETDVDDGAQDVDVDEPTLTAAVAALVGAWQGLSSALSRMPIMERTHDASILRALFHHEMRAGVAAGVIASSERAMLKQWLNDHEPQHTMLSQLLRAASEGGAGAVTAEAAAAAAELAAARQQERHAKLELQHREQHGKLGEYIGDECGKDLTSELSARVIVARALEAAYTEGSLKSFIGRAADDALARLRAAAEASQNSFDTSPETAAPLFAGLEGAEALTTEAVRSKRNPAGMQDGLVSHAEIQSGSILTSMDTFSQHLSALAHAEDKLADAWSRGVASNTGLQGHAIEGRERMELLQAATSLLNSAEAFSGAIQRRGRGGNRGNAEGQGEGQRQGEGKGRGEGKGSGGRGQGSGGQGGRTGRGSGQGGQLQSDSRGGYSETQLKGIFEATEMIERSKGKAKEIVDQQLTNQVLSDVGSEEYTAGLKLVERQIKELRVVLELQEAKQREREWLAHQAVGELDESRLVDGVVGEKLIYRRRADPDVPVGQQLKLPKRLAFVMDVSSSMSRFNGEDGRLDRMMQAVTMIMESLAGFEHMYNWSVVGHSGNGPEIVFVDYGQAPRDRLQRAQVISQMVSASATAASGDSTVEAIEAAVRRVVSQEADDHLVFVVSDANLGGYGITPEILRKVLTAESKVTACAIFIAEKQAADMLTTALPSGIGHVCLEVEKLPNIIKEIFARAAVRD